MVPTRREAQMSMPTVEAKRPALRDQFLIRDDVVFLNHGSYGACPRPVFERYQALQREIESQPVAFLGRELTGRIAAARGALAKYLGADDDEVAYYPNVTQALNVVARSLPLKEGDEVLTTDHEYGALERTWRFMGNKTGARFVTQPLPKPLDSVEAAVEQLWKGVT